jgi:hypothetical protein
MASDSFKNTVISFLLLGVFMVLTVSIVYQMGINYSVSSEKMNEATAGAFNMDDYEAELLDADTDASNFRERFESGNVDDVDDPSGIFSVAGDVIGVITTPYNLLAGIGTNILHIPVVLVHVILAILNITLLAGIWSLLRKGD